MQNQQPKSKQINSKSQSHHQREATFPPMATSNRAKHRSNCPSGLIKKITIIKISFYLQDFIPSSKFHSIIKISFHHQNFIPSSKFHSIIRISFP